MSEPLPRARPRALASLSLPETLFGLGAAGVLLGFVGFTLETSASSQPAASSWDQAASVLNNVWRSFGLLVMQSTVSNSDHALVVVARLLAPAATAGAFYVLTYAYAADWWSRRAVRRMTGNTVIIGLTDQGRAFAESATGDIVVLDPRDRTSVTCPEGARHIEGSGLDPGALVAAGIERARTVVIVTADDAENLQILSRVQACAGRGGRTDVFVRIDHHLLARQLDSDDEFVRPPGHALDVVAFNMDRVAARTFLQDHPLVDLAALHMRRRVHVVIIGWNGFGLELMEQLARLGPYGRFDCPRVDLFAADPDSARAEMIAMQPVLAADMGGAVDLAARVLTIRVHALPAGAAVPTAAQLALTEPDRRRLVSAIVVAMPTDDVSVSTGMALRERTNIEGRWQAPIFVLVRGRSRVTDLLDRHRSHPDAADRIEAVDAIAASCRLERLSGLRESGARAFHAAYRETLTAAQEAGAAGDAAAPWPQLPQTYRNASRRAIDHLPIKLLSAGFTIQPGALGTGAQSDFASDPREVEALARLEHQSWRIDRLLAGWRPGLVRDDRRRVNPALGVDYDALDDTLGAGVTRLDVEQILAARRFLAARGGRTAAREVRLGLFGHNYLTAADGEHIERQLPAAVDAVVNAQQGQFFSIVTPLAPGADLLLTRAVAALLTQRRLEHRVIVVRTLPPSVMLEGFLENRQFAGVWTWPARPLPRGRADAMAALDEERGRVLSTPGALVVNMEPAGSRREHWSGPQGARRRERAYQRANTYLAYQSHVLFACLDPTRQSPVGRAARGGTRDGIERARRIAARRRRAGGLERPSLIVLETTPSSPRA